MAHEQGVKTIKSCLVASPRGFLSRLPAQINFICKVWIRTTWLSMSRSSIMESTTQPMGIKRHMAKEFSRLSSAQISMGWYYNGKTTTDYIPTYRIGLIQYLWMRTPINKPVQSGMILIPIRSRPRSRLLLYSPQTRFQMLLGNPWDTVDINHLTSGKNQGI